MSKYNWCIEDIKRAISMSHNYSEALRILNIPVRGGNLDTLKSKVKIHNIDVSHFTGRNYAHNKISNAYISVADYLGTGKYIHSTKLRNKLIIEGYKENKCECCGITEWNGNPINMQLHHINGNHLDNRLDNLQMLCPNCHSQTDNYCGSANTKEISYCPECGCEKSKNAMYCKNCSPKHRSKLNISDEQLILDKTELKSNVAIANKYGVSETAIRKRLQKIK